MPTPPTFVSGAVLTAAQMNTIGWHLVKTQTIGTAVSTVAVTGAFSTDYDVYCITIAGGAGSAEDSLRMVLGATATGYYGLLQYATYATPGTYTGAADNNAARFSYIGRHTTTSIDANITLRGPFLTEQTFITASWVPTTAAGTYQGLLNNTTSYTDFTISPTTGTLTGGTIRVYGYRNSLT